MGPLTPQLMQQLMQMMAGSALSVPDHPLVAASRMSENVEDRRSMPFVASQPLGRIPASRGTTPENRYNPNTNTMRGTGHTRIARPGDVTPDNDPLVRLMRELAMTPYRGE